MGEGPPRGGTRGGRDRFNWQDVKDDHRSASHYLGASIKAPIGRWAANKDLEWFNKPGRHEQKDAKAENAEAEGRRLEIQRIKQAEEDAVLRALGKAVPDRTHNTNMEPLGKGRDMQCKEEDVQKETRRQSRRQDDERERRHRSSHSSRHGRSRETRRSRSRSRSRHRDRRRRRSSSESRSRSRSKSPSHRRERHPSRSRRDSRDHLDHNRH